METVTILTRKQVEERFDSHFALNFRLLGVIINTKNVGKAERLIDELYSPEEIKNILPYQNWV